MRIVLDTNVLLAAFFGSGLCNALLERLLETPETTIVLSDHILDEFREWAGAKFKAPATDADDALRLLRRASETVAPAPIDPAACNNPDDLPVLGTAVAAQAAALITGDRELLALRTIQGIPTVSPRHFYDSMSN